MLDILIKHSISQGAMYYKDIIDIQYQNTIPIMQAIIY